MTQETYDPGSRNYEAGSDILNQDGKPSHFAWDSVNSESSQSWANWAAGHPNWTYCP